VHVPNASEQWFDEYLQTHGYAFESEPDLGVRTRPDRLIERAGFEAICEVKEFTTDPMRRRWPNGGSQFGSFGGQEWFLTVRRTIASAARQLEPLAGDPRPLVIVLANPNGMNLALDGAEVIQAMYGELQVTFRVNTQTGEPATDPQWELGEGGRLAEEQAPWVSAVAVLRQGDLQADWTRQWIEMWKAANWPEEPRSEQEAAERWQAWQQDLEAALAAGEAPEGEYYYLETIETLSQDAAQLPHEIFDGDRDRRWVVNEAASYYELLE